MVVVVGIERKMRESVVREWWWSSGGSNQVVMIVFYRLERVRDKEEECIFIYLNIFFIYYTTVPIY
ncbi:hypothetical protein HanRHA438_Chr07g0316631 [Helianthus annuus]|nr:hypothetical protein HanIR_Chr07g0332031 [Helianthus annuus]KAJ0908993.1 hypothetical protein HanRHA438_Chr07g0316631 [Helianthus annuus]